MAETQISYGAALAPPRQTAQRTPRNRERFYDSIADTFDDVMNEYDVARRLHVVFNDFLADVDLRGKTLLDAGCGTGRFSEAANARGALVTSLDIGPRLLAQVRRKCPAKIVCSDVTRMPFPTNAFDVVVSSECIEHTPDPAAAVGELVRVCRPGGHIVITCPNRAWHWSLTIARVLHLRPYDGLENWPSWGSLGRWVEGAGGRILRRTGIHLFPFVLSSLERTLTALDRFGPRLGRLYVNQALLAMK